MLRRILLIVLALPLTAYSGCAHGDSSGQRTRVNPSSDFLFTAAKEASENKMGPTCSQIADDWIAQNAPKEVSK